MNDPEQSKALVTTEIRVPATLDPAAGSANPFGRAIVRRRLSDLNFLPSSRQIKQSGVTIVWIEHIVHALVAVVSRLVVLNFGRKIVEGEPRTVMVSDQVREIYMGIAA